MKTLILLFILLMTLSACGRANCIAWQSATQQYPAVMYQPQSTNIGPSACPFNFAADVPASQIIKVIN
jgi:uncharacterized protein YceK